MNFFALVNPKSGSRAGQRLIQQFAEYGVRAASLLDRAATDTLLQDIVSSARSNLPQTRVIAAGGDGTVSSVISLLQKKKLNLPVAPLPLGTGNELAYCTGWSDFVDAKNLEKFFAAVEAGSVTGIDLWRTLAQGAAGENLSFDWQSFFSIGMDARVVYSHASLQRKHPWLYRYRSMSLIWYVIFGIYEAFFRRLRIGKHLLITSQKNIFSAPRAGILHILNIPTSGGHTDYFGEAQFDKVRITSFQRPAIGDNVLEVSATEGIRSFLKSVLKLGPVKRVGQVKELDIQINPNFPQRIQVDGEMVENLIVSLKITHRGQHQVVLGPGKRKGC